MVLGSLVLEVFGSRRIQAIFHESATSWLFQAKLRIFHKIRLILGQDLYTVYLLPLIPAEELLLFFRTSLEKYSNSGKVWLKEVFRGLGRGRCGWG